MPLFLKKIVMPFKQVEVLKLLLFLQTFGLYTKTTVPILRLCSMEKPGFGNLLCLSSHNMLSAGKNHGFFGNPFDRFLEFLTVL